MKQLSSLQGPLPSAASARSASRSAPHAYRRSVRWPLGRAVTFGTLAGALGIAASTSCGSDDEAGAAAAPPLPGECAQNFCQVSGATGGSWCDGNDMVSCGADELGCGVEHDRLPCAEGCVGGACVSPLDLELTVHERSGVERSGTVVTSGVPFPPGRLPDASSLGVVDGDGNPVAAQASAIVRWHAPAYDDSVQWALVSFPADVGASETSTYRLVEGQASVLPEQPVELVDGAGEITVTVGDAVFVVPKQGSAIVTSATLGGQGIIGGEGLRATLRTGEWADRGLAADSEHVSSHSEVVIEEQGPVRVVLAIPGQFAPGDQDGKLYHTMTRLSFLAGDPSVRVVVTIENSELDPTLVDDWRSVYFWPIEDASLVADLALGAGSTARALTAAGVVQASADGEPLSVYQDSSGGDQWRDLPGGNYEQWLSGYTDGLTVRGVSFRGYQVTQGASVLDEGDAARGVLDVSASSGGLTAALRNFRVEYPSAMAGSASSLRIGLFPGEFSEPFHLENGQRKSWDVRLTLHGPGEAPLDVRHAELDTTLAFRADPSWMRDAALAGAWPAGLALLDPPEGFEIAPRADKDSLDGIDTGWDWYGWIPSFNSGGGHWNQNTTLASWLLWADGAGFDLAEKRALWAADVVNLHYRSPSLETFWLFLRDWNWHENRLQALSYPDFYSRITWGIPDMGHMGMFMWFEYYLLTGDLRVRDALESLGIRARARLWQYAHDDVDDGSGPLAHAIDWCARRDPDAEPDFRLDTRYLGWPLFDLSFAYRLSGDPAMLDEARIVAGAFRNTARYSPIGFMTTQVNEIDDESVYGGQGPFCVSRAESASQCYAHFQQGIMATGLIEYYLQSRDPEALDALVGFADHAVHHAMLRDASDRPIGWTYAFGDYWGPYTEADLSQCGDPESVSWFTSNFRVVQPLGFITLLTGRSDYRAILDAAVGNMSDYDYGASWHYVIGALMAQQNPKADAVAPAAIGDLVAQPTGAGAVVLGWTAPGDDGAEGTAHHYQLKYSPATIVELVTGWPDRSDPLPTTAAEWEARASAFNAHTRAYWAAFNAPDEPTPQGAGSVESMTVSGLAPGSYSFAIRTWDDADNVSELSNVVTVTVP